MMTAVIITAETMGEGGLIHISRTSPLTLCCIYRHEGDLENIVADDTGKAVINITVRGLKLEKIINRSELAVQSE
jgi:hypothetical protein